MTWDAYHRRNAVLRDAIDIADRRRDGVLPWSELEAARAAFDSPTDLLLALQMRWNTRLRALVEHELDEHPDDLFTAVSRAWRNAAADLPGVRAILDEADDPELGMARANELAFLARAAGLASGDGVLATEHGRRIVDDARAISIERQQRSRRGNGLIRRVREAIVA